jgi:uncharacterized protein (DUF1697 family)
MTTYVALLRGVNVGNRKVPMEDLRELAVGLGFSDVATYIQPGNLLFESGDGPEGIRDALEGALKERFGREIPVAVRTGPQMVEAYQGCPFVPAEGEVVYVGFLVCRASADLLAALADEGRAEGDDRDAAVVADDRVYVLYRHGVHVSPLSNAWMERRLKVPVTSRNLRTVHQVATRAGALV